LEDQVGEYKSNSIQMQLEEHFKFYVEEEKTILFSLEKQELEKQQSLR
jgi:hypothetical protein